MVFIRQFSGGGVKIKPIYSINIQLIFLEKKLWEKGIQKIVKLNAIHYDRIRFILSTHTCPQLPSSYSLTFSFPI